MGQRFQTQLWLLPSVLLLLNIICSPQVVLFLLYKLQKKGKKEGSENVSFIHTDHRSTYSKSVAGVF